MRALIGLILLALTVSSCGVYFPPTSSICEVIHYQETNPTMRGNASQKKYRKQSRWDKPERRYRYTKNVFGAVWKWNGEKNNLNNQKRFRKRDRSKAALAVSKPKTTGSQTVRNTGEKTKTAKTKKSLQ